jgi:hypothetical protein
MESSYFCPEDDISFSIQSYLTLTEKLKVRELNREWHRKVIHSFLDLEKDRLNVVLPFFLKKREERNNDFWFSMYDRHFLSFVQCLELRIEDDNSNNSNNRMSCQPNKQYKQYKQYDEMDMNLVVYPRTIKRVCKFLENVPDWFLESSRQKIWKIRHLNPYYHTPILYSYTFKKIIMDKLYEIREYKRI